MREDRAPNGGFYLPFRMPAYTQDDLSQMKSKSFGQNVAEVMEGFFACGLSSWDVEFAIGRYPVKLTALGQRIWAGELWHNQENSYSHLERALCDRICPELFGKPIPSWLRIAVRIDEIPRAARQKAGAFRNFCPLRTQYWSRRAQVYVRASDGARN